MRTKTLLLTAALTAAGAATSLAQAVYSQNIVGYINLTVQPGFSMIANQLNASPNNKVTSIIAAPPNNTQIYKFDPSTGGFVQNTFVGGTWEGDDLDMTLNPGEGVFIKNSTASNFTITLLGEVALQSSIAIPTGFSVRSSALPIAGKLTDPLPTGLGFPVQSLDNIFAVDRATGGFAQDTFIGGAWEGDHGGEVPLVALGESFFFKAAAGHPNWVQNFSVGQ